MTKKRRYLISTAVLVAACVCVALGVLAMMPPCPEVTKANFDRVEKGMTSAELKAIFGKPSAEGERGISWYHTDGSNVYVRLDHDKAIEKEYRPSSETYTDKLRRWLHLPE